MKDKPPYKSGVSELRDDRHGSQAGLHHQRRRQHGSVALRLAQCRPLQRDAGHDRERDKQHRVTSKSASVEAVGTRCGDMAMGMQRPHEEPAAAFRPLDGDLAHHLLEHDRLTRGSDRDEDNHDQHRRARHLHQQRRGRKLVHSDRRAQGFGSSLFRQAAPQCRLRVQHRGRGSWTDMCELHISPRLGLASLAQVVSHSVEAVHAITAKLDRGGQGASPTKLFLQGKPREAADMRKREPPSIRTCGGHTTVYHAREEAGAKSNNILAHLRDRGGGGGV